jgi:hypothetical protein
MTHMNSDPPEKEDLTNLKAILVFLLALGVGAGLYAWPKLTYAPKNHIWIYEPDVIPIIFIGLTIVLTFVGSLLKARKFCIGCLVFILLLVFYYHSTFADGPYLKEDQIVLEGKAYRWNDIKYAVLDTSLDKGHPHVYFDLHFHDGEVCTVGMRSVLATDVNGLNRVYHQLLKYRIPIQKEPLDEDKIKHIKFDLSDREEKIIFSMYQ